MIRFVRKIEIPPDTAVTLSLTFEQRSRTRMRVMLDDGREAGLFLPRGTQLRHGDGLIAEDGSVARLRASPETLSRVESDDAFLLARACYHLGNRHVALQIEPAGLSYPHDHVLDDLVRGLGLAVSTIQAPFAPEPGAYGGAVHAHGNGHGHGHDHDHEH